MLRVWQDCVFGSFSIAFLLWDKHGSDHLQQRFFSPMLALPASPAPLVTAVCAELQPCPKPGRGCACVGRGL